MLVSYLGTYGSSMRLYVVSRYLLCGSFSFYGGTDFSFFVWFSTGRSWEWGTVVFATGEDSARPATSALIGLI